MQRWKWCKDGSDAKLKGRKKNRWKKTLKGCSKSKRPQEAVSTHHGDSWPAQQPPYWHSADNCGSVPCAPPVNCAACSSGHSSCTCEASPLWKEWECQVKSTATHFYYQQSHLCNKPLLWWKDTLERLLKSQTFFPAPFSCHIHLLPPDGYFAPSLFHTNMQYQQKEKEADLLVAKQTDDKRGKQTKQLNHTPALPVCHQVLWERNFWDTLPTIPTVAFTKTSCPSGLILLPTVRKCIT